MGHSIKQTLTAVLLVTGCTAAEPSLIETVDSQAGSLTTTAAPHSDTVSPPSRFSVKRFAMPVYFVENGGRFDPQVRFLIPGKDTTVYFTPDAVTMALHETPNSDEKAQRRWVIKLEFIDANPDALLEAGEKTQATFNYFRGRKSKWKTGLRSYNTIIYQNLWPGIDLVYHGTENKLKHTFIVHPGADPNRIRLRYHGVDALHVSDDDTLIIDTPARKLFDEPPYVYQNITGARIEITAHYDVTGTTYGFRLGLYDPTQPLYLDPATLVRCGYIGGSDAETTEESTLDSSGSIYVVGQTNSTESESFPVTVGPDLTQNDGDTDLDAFIAKVSVDGTSLIYAGFIGGDDRDFGFDIAVDSSGNAYVVGSTQSTDTSFPTAVGPSLTRSGTSDGYITKVSSDGTSILYSGFIGGSDVDSANAVAVDSSGNAFIAGSTSSTPATFPETVGPYLTYAGGGDIFVAKLLSGGTTYAYNGYIGGSGSDSATDIAIDSSGAAYIIGRTSSSEGTFPVTVGPELVYDGSNDAFVGKVASSGTSLTYLGYIGGTSNDSGEGIDVDSTGAAYVTGVAYSDETTFSETVGPVLTHSGGPMGFASDCFVGKVNTTGSAYDYLGYIGGSGQDLCEDIAVGAHGQAYVVGRTTSTSADGFPLVDGPDLTHNSNYDAFVSKVASDGSTFLYSGYIGGSGSDSALGISIDSDESAYIAGETFSTESTFPVSVGPDLTQNGSRDTFVAKVESPQEGVSCDSATSGSGTTSALSWSHTVSSGDNRVLVVGVSIRNSASQTVNPTTKITYGTQELTKAGEQNNSTNARTEIWYLVAPTAGTDTVTVNLTASAKVVGGAWSCQEVHQTTPLGTFTSAQGATDPATVAVSSAIGELVFDTLAMQTDGTVTVGASQTSLWNAAVSSGPGAARIRGAGSWEAGATSVTMSWSGTSTNAWAIGAVALKPAVVTAIGWRGGAARSGQNAYGQNGIELTWQTGWEIENLGYHIYRRHPDGKRTRLTHGLIVGSALTGAQSMGHSRPDGRGLRRYRWWHRGGRVGDTYDIEAIDLSGRRTRHGPLIAQAGPRIPTTSRTTKGASYRRIAQARAALSTAPSPYGDATLPGLQQTPLSPTSARLEAQQRLAANGAYITDITREGPQKLSWQRLRDTLGSRANDATLRITADGEPVSFQPTVDGIIFYAAPLDTSHSAARRYWLTLEDAASHSDASPHTIITPRSPSDEIPPCASPEPLSLTLEKQTRSLYLAALRNGSQSNFVGSLIRPTAAATERFIIPHLDRRRPGNLKVTLQGVSRAPHHVRVTLNTTELGEVTFSDMQRISRTFPLPPSALSATSNTVTFEALANDTDISAVISTRLTYPHTEHVDGGMLRFILPQGRCTQLRGFASGHLYIWDITDPWKPKVVLDTKASSTTDALAVHAREGQEGTARTLIAFSDQTLATPTALSPDTPSRWHDAPPAILTIIAPSRFHDTLLPLVTRREREGLSVNLIDIADLYDEYSFGHRSPTALSHFLNDLTQHRGQRTSFVLLAGDSSFDPRNHLGQGALDLVPTKLIDTGFLETASDTALADNAGEGFGDHLAIGRLPAQTPDELATMVAKVLAYTDDMPIEQYTSLWVRGRDDGTSFVSREQELRARLPATVSAQSIALGAQSSDTWHRDLETPLGLVHYLGHGSVGVWDGDALSNTDIATLNAQGRRPLVISLSCLNGFFHDVYSESLAEAFLRSPHGATAVFASSALTHPDAQLPMDKPLLHHLYTDSPHPRRSRTPCQTPYAQHRCAPLLEPAR